MKQKGFTLVELLAVIAIIGIISTIAIVNLSNARNEAHITAVQETIDAIHRAAISCLAQDDILWEDRNAIPTALTCDGTGPFVLGAEMCDGIRWPSQLQVQADLGPGACVYIETAITCKDNGAGGCYLIFFDHSADDLITTSLCSYNWSSVPDGCWITPT